MLFGGVEIIRLVSSVLGKCREEARICFIVFEDRYRDVFGRFLVLCGVNLRFNDSRGCDDFRFRRE